MNLFGEAKIPTSLKRARNTAAKRATRDQQGRFARKGFFTSMFDGIEHAVTGVKRAHRKVKRVQRTIKRAFRAQPRMVNATPKKRRRVVKKRPATSGRIPNYRSRVIRGLLR